MSDDCATCGHDRMMHFISDTNWCGADRSGRPESEYCKCQQFIAAVGGVGEQP